MKICSYGSRVLLLLFSCSTKFTKAINNFYAQIRLQIKMLCALFVFFSSSIKIIWMNFLVLFDFHDQWDESRTQTHTHMITFLLILIPPVMHLIHSTWPKYIWRMLLFTKMKCGNLNFRKRERERAFEMKIAHIFVHFSSTTLLMLLFFFKYQYRETAENISNPKNFLSILISFLFQMIWIKENIEKMH